MLMTQSIPKLSAQILEEASAWFVDFNEEEVDQAGSEEFIAWLRRSPEHVRAFLQVSAFWEDAGTLGKRCNLDIDGLVARAKAEHNVYALTSTARDSTSDAATTSEQSAAASRSPEALWERSRSKRLWLAAAASILMVLGIGTIAWYSDYRGANYATEIGEQRSITLEDGSSVELNSRSRIQVRFTKTQRSVDLLEGQALFTVAKNPARPFIVATGDGQVRAVGTQFDVYRKHSGTVVTVVEGRVAVAPSWMRAPRRGSPVSAESESTKYLTRETDELASARARSDVKAGAPSLHSKEDGPGVRPGEILLAAGEQMMIAPAAIELPKPANIDITTAWTDRKLIFESTPLREVVEEFNRYNRQQLVIRDPDLYDFHVSGVFPSTNPSRMVEFLRQRFGVTMNRSRDEIEIFRRERSETLPRLQKDVGGSL
jgi:transmembrane sensor